MPSNKKSKDLHNTLIIGYKIDKLTIISKPFHKHDGQLLRIFYECSCDCGRIIEKSRDYLVDARIKLHNCGCIKRICKLSAIDKIVNIAIAQYKCDAVRRGRNYKWGLSTQEAKTLFTSACHYCGKLPNNDKLNGIDRINNNGDYIIDNCVSCCQFCNIAKRDLSIKQFLKNITRIYIHQSYSDNIDMLVGSPC